MTLSQAMEAERESRAQRIHNAKLIEADESLMRPEDKPLVERFFQTAKGDGSDLDKALAHPAVNELFLRGVMKIKSQTDPTP